MNILDIKRAWFTVNSHKVYTAIGNQVGASGLQAVAAKLLSTPNELSDIIFINDADQQEYMGELKDWAMLNFNRIDAWHDGNNRRWERYVVANSRTKKLVEFAYSEEAHELFCVMFMTIYMRDKLPAKLRGRLVP